MYAAILNFAPEGQSSFSIISCNEQLNGSFSLPFDQNAMGKIRQRILLCTCKMYLVFLLSSLHTPSNLINIQGHELEGAFIVRALACLEIHGQITLLKYVLTYSLFQF